jgi:hypothetical protein
MGKRLALAAWRICIPAYARLQGRGLRNAKIPPPTVIINAYHVAAFVATWRAASRFKYATAFMGAGA